MDFLNLAARSLIKISGTLLLLACLSPLSAQANQCPAQLNSIPLQNFACADQWLTELFQELNCPITFLPMKVSMSRRMRLLLDGQVQVLLGLSRTPEREQQFQFSVPIATHKLNLYGLKGSTVSSSIKQWCDVTMRSAKLILPPRGHFGPKVEALKQGDQCAAQLIYAPLGTEQASKMLIAGRGDLIIASEHWLESQPPDIQNAIKKLDILVLEENTELAFKGLNNEFIERTNHAIEAKLAAGATLCGLAPRKADATLRD
ncbi:transporter substrate-binding domain-containing protein [Simiduia curdlanivorans]|uniref:Substrate-binding periplasmic protein n=1 Tax=Simiduia curdlanivorans TaxID=1492769 RepID=A0ABV8V332_9GAMM|nr:transporter substrate-binding domain-containing protein [Simiduia curdlanivorans]MDN3637501.1 transporter substrate-binding domain-containing protein [Simiduia curdlanivorans]